MLIFFISIAIFMWALEKKDCFIHTHDPSRRDLVIHLVEISANIWRESVLFTKLGNKTKLKILKAEHFSEVSLLSPLNASLHCDEYRHQRTWNVCSADKPLYRIIVSITFEILTRNHAKYLETQCKRLYL